MLGCEGVKVYQFFYQSKEDFDNMDKNHPQLFIIRPIYVENVAVYEYNLGKHIPLQLIIDVFEQSQYFRLRVGLVMMIIQQFVKVLLEQSEIKMFNHDLEAKNIWILFSKGSLGPEFNDAIDFNIQIQGRWKQSNVQSYIEKIFNIIKKLSSLMDLSIPKKQKDKKECEEIKKLQNLLRNLYTADTINKLYFEIQNIQFQFGQQGNKLRLDVFKKEKKRTNRIQDAEKDIKQIFNHQINQFNNQKIQLLKYIYIQYETQNKYHHLIDFTRHFYQQLNDLFYSNFKLSTKHEIIDLSTFINTQQKVQQNHRFKIDKIPSINDEIIKQSFAIRGYLNYPNKLIDPSFKINILIRDSLQFYLSEAYNVQMLINKTFNINDEKQQTANNNFSQIIAIQQELILIQTDMEQFQSKEDYLKGFYDGIFRQYSNCVKNIVKDLFLDKILNDQLLF